MYKTLCLALVLTTPLALAQDTKHAASSTESSPKIVAKGRLPGQTAPIPTTTIFIPKTDGLYRLSVYATLLSAPCTTGGNWNFNLAWTDDAGPQSLYSLLWGYDCNYGYGQFWQLQSIGGVPLGGPTTTFEAKTGTPITYSVTYQGDPDGTSYSLYYTLERLE